MRMQNKEQGFGLVEALVALVVISVGMIGIAALYGQGLSASRTAFYRTQAVYLASDLADRIRGNRRGGMNYTGVGADNDCDEGVDCTPAEMAQHDVDAWRAQVAAVLPGPGVGTVVPTGTTPPTYTITVQWQEVVGGQQTLTMAVRVPGL
jgi:type IV pilus assembly protein PilV